MVDTQLRALENAALRRNDIQVFGSFRATTKKELQALVEPLGLKVKNFKDRSRATLASRELRSYPDAPVYLRLARSYQDEHSWRLYLLWAGERLTVTEELDDEIRSLLSKPGSELVYSNPIEAKEAADADA